VVGDCHLPQFVGKTSLAIYKLEDGTLTLTSNPPGKGEAPSAFDARGAAHMEFKRN
jgi:hypothetical protein